MQWTQSHDCGTVAEVRGIIFTLAKFEVTVYSKKYLSVGVLDGSLAGDESITLKSVALTSKVRALTCGTMVTIYFRPGGVSCCSRMIMSPYAPNRNVP